MNQQTGMFGSSGALHPKPQPADNSGGGLSVGKQDSVGFQQASGSDSEFEYIDDYIDEAEEFNGASRAVKMSIRALNFNMMLAEKQKEQDPGQYRQKISLLSRASNLVQQNNTNKGGGSDSQKRIPLT